MHAYFIVRFRCLNFVTAPIAMNLIVLSIPIFFVLISAEAIYDYFTGRRYYRLNDALANISCGIFEQITGLFMKVFTVALYLLVYEHFAQFSVPTSWPWLIVMFVGIDLCYYWAHRHSHTINLFWTGHVVHHQSEDYNLSVALRQGALQKVFTAAYYLPMAILGFDPEWFLAVNAIQTLYQFWIHTELVNKMGVFGFVFNTPSHHRVHHGRDPKYIDKNHGGTLIIWDRIFGTFQAEEEKPTYGITTPLTTFDPVGAHLDPWRNLGSDLKRTPGFLNKIKLLFAKPGWLPAEVGGFRPPKPVDKTAYRKFDVEVPLGLNYYLFIQYLITLAGTAVYLFTASKLPDAWRIAFAVALLYSIMLHGLLHSGRRWAVWAEVVRWLGLSVMAVLMSYLASAPLWLGGVVGGVAGLSIFWVLRYRHARISIKKPRGGDPVTPPAQGDHSHARG